MPDNRARLRRALADFRGRTAEPLPERVPGRFLEYVPGFWYCWVELGTTAEPRAAQAINLSGRTDLAEGDPVMMHWAENNPPVMLVMEGRPYVVPCVPIEPWATITHVAWDVHSNRLTYATPSEGTYGAAATAWYGRGQFADFGLTEAGCILPHPTIQHQFYLYIRGNPGWTFVQRVEPDGTIERHAGRMGHDGLTYNSYADVTGHYRTWHNIGKDRTDAHFHIEGTSQGSSMAIDEDDLIYAPTMSEYGAIMTIPDSGGMDVILHKHQPEDTGGSGAYAVTGAEEGVASAGARMQFGVGNIGDILLHPTDGSLYYADVDNYIIRRIAAPLDGTGTVQTVAGIWQQYPPANVDGAALSTKLGAPWAMVWLSDGSLAFTESGEVPSRIRKLTPAGQIVTIKSGINNDWMTALAVDDCDNLYYGEMVDVAGTDHWAIQRLAPGGTVTTMMIGSNPAGTYTPGTHTAVTGTQTVSATNPPAAGSATLGPPHALRLDAWGSLYVADGDERVIRRLDPA